MEKKKRRRRRNPHRRNVECGWFTDSGFGLTILVVFGHFGAKVLLTNSDWNLPGSLQRSARVYFSQI